MYKLSPSDFRYLWHDCKHCFYQKLKFGISLPSIGLPGVFMKMNSLLQNHIVGMNLKDINSELPSGIISVKEGFLRSVPVPNKKDSFISGRFDILSKLDDGSYAVIDFKITDPKDGQAAKFSNQLHAYKFALENPIFPYKPRKISRMGLISVSPESIKLVDGKIVFSSVPKLHSVEENMGNFYSFIDEVSTVLNGPLPMPSETCAWCKYREYFKTDASKVENDIPF